MLASSPTSAYWFHPEPESSIRSSVPLWLVLKCVHGCSILSHSSAQRTTWTPWTAARPPGFFSGHGIFQASILEWVAISFSRRSSWPRDWTRDPALQTDSLLLSRRESPVCFRPVSNRESSAWWGECDNHYAMERRQVKESKYITLIFITPRMLWPWVPMLWLPFAQGVHLCLSQANYLLPFMQLHFLIKLSTLTHLEWRDLWFASLAYFTITECVIKSLWKNSVWKNCFVANFKNSMIKAFQTNKRRREFQELWSSFKVSFSFLKLLLMLMFILVESYER